MTIRADRIWNIVGVETKQKNGKKIGNQKSSSLLCHSSCVVSALSPSNFILRVVQ